MEAAAAADADAENNLTPRPGSPGDDRPYTPSRVRFAADTAAEPHERDDDDDDDDDDPSEEEREGGPAAVMGPVLDAARLKSGLRQPERVGDSTAFALTRLDLRDAGLTSLESATPDLQPTLSALGHLRHVQLSGNALSTLAPLAVLRNLITVDARRNNIASVVPSAVGHRNKDAAATTATGTAAGDGKKVSEEQQQQQQSENHGSSGSLSILFPKVQLLQLDDNNLKCITGIAAPRLLALSVASNKIKSLRAAAEAGNAGATAVGGGLHRTVEVLNVSTNRLSSLEGLNNYPNLRILNVAGNTIQSLKGVGAACPKLERLDVRNNDIASLREFSALIPCEALHTLYVEEGNDALAEEAQEDIALEMVMLLPQLKVIDGEPVTYGMRREAQNIVAEREAERKRIEEEEKEERERMEKEEEEERKRLEEEAAEEERLRREEEEAERIAEEEARAEREAEELAAAEADAAEAEANAKGDDEESEDEDDEDDDAADV